MGDTGLDVAGFLPKPVIHHSFNHFIPVVAADGNAESPHDDLVVFDRLNFGNGNNIEFMYADKRLIIEILLHVFKVE